MSGSDGGRDGRNGGKGGVPPEREASAGIRGARGSSRQQQSFHRMRRQLPGQAVLDGPHRGERPLAPLRTQGRDDLSVALLDAWAAVQDVLGFYQERIAGEGYLGSAAEPRSVQELARSVGYEFRPGVAASTALAFTLDDTPDAPGRVSIPKGLRVLSIPGPGQRPQPFETVGALDARASLNRVRCFPKPRPVNPFAAGSKDAALRVGLDAPKPDPAAFARGSRLAIFDHATAEFASVSALESRDHESVLQWSPGIRSRTFGAFTTRIAPVAKRLGVFGAGAPDHFTRAQPGDDGATKLVGGDTEFHLPLGQGSPLDLDAQYDDVRAGSQLLLVKGGEAGKAGWARLAEVAEAGPAGAQRGPLQDTVTRVKLNLRVESAPVTVQGADGRLHAFAVGDDGAVWMLHESGDGPGWSPWMSLGGQADAVVAERDGEGRLHVFARGRDGSVWHRVRGGDGAWGEWVFREGRVDLLVAGRNRDSRIEVFARGADKTLVHMWQQPDGTWTKGWGGLGGGPIDLLCVASKPGPDASLHVFVRRMDDKTLWRLSQRPEGGWGDWARLGEEPRQVDLVAVGVNADARLEVFARGQDRALWHAWETGDGAWSGWASLGGRIDLLAVGRNADGRLEAFARGMDKGLYHRWQVEPNGGWGAWDAMGGTIDQLAVGNQHDGRLAVFARGTDKALWHVGQLAPNSRWTPWSPMGGELDMLAVVQNQDGRLEVFARGTDSALWHMWQLAPNGDWSGWASLGGQIDLLAAGQNQDGRIEVFARGMDKALWHIWQVAPNSGWGPWASLGGLIELLAVGRNQDGRLEVFARGMDKALWHIAQTAPNDGWGPWSSLGGTIDLLSVASNADGRLEVFARGADKGLWHVWQAAPNGAQWTPWASLGGRIDALATGRNADGRLEVFSRGLDGALWHVWQQTGGGWSPWASLGGFLEGQGPAAGEAARPAIPTLAAPAHASSALASASPWSPLGTPGIAGISGIASVASIAGIAGIAGIAHGLPGPVGLAVANAADGRLEVYVRGANDALQRIGQTEANGAWGPWEELGGQADLLAVGPNQDGRLDVFARGRDRALWHVTQLVPNARWGPWTSMGGMVDMLAVAQNQDGRLEAFARGMDKAVWHAWETKPGGPWSAWASLGAPPTGLLTTFSPTFLGGSAGPGVAPSVGGPGTGAFGPALSGGSGLGEAALADSTFTPVLVPWLPVPRTGQVDLVAVGRNQDGRLEVFARGADKALWHTWQLDPPGEDEAPKARWSAWASLGGAVDMLAVAQNQDGRLEVFARGTDRALYSMAQTAPNSGWTPWNRLGGIIDMLAVGRNQDGRLEVLGRGTDKALYHLWQQQVGGSYTDWARLGGVIEEVLTVALDAEGRLQAFARGTDKALWTIGQVSPNGGWSGWSSLGGLVQAAVVGANLDGRLELFARGGDDDLWHNWQLPAGGWSGWSSLGGSAQTLAVGSSKGGRLTVLAAGLDHEPRSIAQGVADTGWSGRDSFGGALQDVAAATNRRGGLELFARAPDGTLRHAAELQPGAPWSRWTSLGGSIGPFAVARNADGRLEVFACGAADHALWHLWELPAGGWSDWQSLGGWVDTLAVGQNKDGRLEVFVRGKDHAAYSMAQLAPNGGWGPFNRLGGRVDLLAVGQNQDGRLEVFARGGDLALYHLWQQELGGRYSEWARLGGQIQALAVGQNSDGRLEVFARGMDSALHHMWQLAPNGGWSAWQSLGGWIDMLEVGQNSDGRLEVLARGRDGALYHIHQAVPSGGWAPWDRLGGAVADSMAVVRDAQPDAQRLHAFVRNYDGTLSHIAQAVANAGWGPWASAGLPAPDLDDLRTLSVYLLARPPLAVARTRYPEALDPDVLFVPRSEGLPDPGPLEPGRAIVVEDEKGKARAQLAEVVDAAAVDTDDDGAPDHLAIRVRPPLAAALPTATAVLRGNVVEATHGETVRETLGSGDASRAFQRFALRRAPLTYIAAATSTGVQSTLEVRVGGVLWREVPSLAHAMPREQAYMVRVDERGKAWVVFGDGTHGARLPTGSENVEALYRVGIGGDGEVPAKAISLLQTRPLGVRGVTNPLPSEGAAPPEGSAEARANAPSSALALDRVVSVRDYEDLVRNIGGVGKAQAGVLPAREGEMVHVTVAGADGRPLDGNPALLARLRASIEHARGAGPPVVVAGARLLPFDLRAKVLVEPGRDAATVLANVAAALRERFAFPRRAFAQPVLAAEAITAIQSVPGVQASDLDALHLHGEPPGFHNALLASRAHMAPEGPQPAELLLLRPEGLSVEPMEVA